MSNNHHDINTIILQDISQAITLNTFTVVHLQCSKTSQTVHPLLKTDPRAQQKQSRTPWHIQALLHNTPILVSRSQRQYRGPTNHQSPLGRILYQMQFYTIQTKVLGSALSSPPPCLLLHPMCTSRQSATNFNSWACLQVAPSLTSSHPNSKQYCQSLITHTQGLKDQRPF